MYFNLQYFLKILGTNYKIAIMHLQETGYLVGVPDVHHFFCAGNVSNNPHPPG